MVFGPCLFVLQVENILAAAQEKSFVLIFSAEGQRSFRRLHSERNGQELPAGMFPPIKPFELFSSPVNAI
jgi:hypothetical protein